MTIFFLLPCWLKLKLQLVFLMDERSGIDFEHFFLEIHESLKGLHISIIHASIDFFSKLVSVGPNALREVPVECISP